MSLPCSPSSASRHVGLRRNSTAKPPTTQKSYRSKNCKRSKTTSRQSDVRSSVLPFGTHLKVTNLRNNKSVIVKVIDRGPFGRGRIIDLSWAAAKEIGMIAQGVASVKVEIVEKPVPFRPEEEKLPQIDFEVAESDYTLEPHWNSKSAKGKAHQGKNLKKWYIQQRRKKPLQRKMRRKCSTGKRAGMTQNLKAARQLKLSMRTRFIETNSLLK